MLHGRGGAKEEGKSRFIAIGVAGRGKGEKDSCGYRWRREKRDEEGEFSG